MPVPSACGESLRRRRNTESCPSGHGMEGRATTFGTGCRADVHALRLDLADGLATYFDIEEKLPKRHR
jgi:hypothetical protein